MSYRRCFSTLGCHELSLNEVLDLAHRYGIDAVELRGLGGTLDVPEYLTHHYTDLSAVAEIAKKSAADIVALNTSFHLTGDGEAERADLLRYATCAEKIGVPWLRIFDGGKTGSADELNHAVATLAWWKREREKNAWRTDVMIETHDALVTLPLMAQMRDKAPDLHFLWDAHHTWKKGGVAPTAVWQELHEHIVHIHVKDSISQPSGNSPYTYVLPGEGEFPIQPLLTALAKQKYNGCVSLEWERKWHPDLPPLDRALESAKAHAWW